MPLLMCLAVAFASNPGPGSDSYIARVAHVVEQAGANCNRMEDSVREAASRLLKGGKLWAAGNPAFMSEMCGRAGGLMLIQSLGDATPAAGDVVMYGLSGERQPIPDSIGNSGAHIALFGDAAGSNVSPSLASIVHAWIYTGMLIEACARQGKMPVTFETIGLPGGYPRIQQYQAKGILWIDHAPAALEEAKHLELGRRYADNVAAILNRVEREDREKLNRAGEWAARALAEGKTVYMYCMGHFVPDEVAKSEIGAKFKTATWNSGFTTQAVPDDRFNAGDLAIHIGYQHPPNGLYERARPAGTRIVYVDLLEHRDWKTDADVIWIDPMWPWDDAVVTFEGYDIPMLPPSGIVNSAIAWEIYRLATK